MKSAGTRLRSIGRLRIWFRRLEILRLHRGPILYHSDVRRSRWSWRSVPLGPHRQMFELPLLLAPTQGAAS
jgi:hypothetical protein